MNRKQIKKSKKWICLVLCGLALAGTALWKILPDCLDNLSSAAAYEDLRDRYTDAPEGPAGEQKEDWWLTDVVVRFDALKKENADIVAWLRSDNPEELEIDYPVLYSGDNTEYLRHDLYGREHTAGSIFLEGLNQPDFSDHYIIIYGHNMKNGEMFTDLIKYQSEDYYKAHPIIRFTTANEDSTYEIFSVFKSRVYYKSETNVFRYYNFINANDEAEYNEFVEKAKSSSIYDTGITASYGDDLITLITCSYHVDDGRFVVIGRKFSVGDGP